MPDFRPQKTSHPAINLSYFHNIQTHLGFRWAGVFPCQFSSQVLQRVFFSSCSICFLFPSAATDSAWNRIRESTISVRGRRLWHSSWFDNVLCRLRWVFFLSFLGGRQHYKAFNLNTTTMFLAGKSISAASGARIQFPCNRLYPLSFYASKYGQHGGIGGIRGPSPLNSPSPVPSSPGFRYCKFVKLSTCEPNF